MKDALVQKVTAILAEEDIEGLVTVGAPRDEYTREASLVVDSILYWDKPGFRQGDFYRVAVRDVRKWLESAFTQTFGGTDRYSERAFDKAAERIFAAYEEERKSK